MLDKDDVTCRQVALRLAGNPRALASLSATCRTLRRIVSDVAIWQEAIRRWASDNGVEALATAEEQAQVQKALALSSFKELRVALGAMGPIVGVWRAAGEPPSPRGLGRVPGQLPRGGVVKVSTHPPSRAIVGRDVPAKALVEGFGFKISSEEKIFSVSARLTDDGRIDVRCEHAGHEPGVFRRGAVRWMEDGGVSLEPLSHLRLAPFPRSSGSGPEWAEGLQGVHTAIYGPHSDEAVCLRIEGEEGSLHHSTNRFGIACPRLVAIKLEGDPHVPAGEVTFVASLHDEDVYDMAADMGGAGRPPADGDERPIMTFFRRAGPMIVNMADRGWVRRVRAKGQINEMAGWWDPRVVDAELIVYRENGAFEHRLDSSADLPISFSLLWESVANDVYRHAIDFFRADENVLRASWSPNSSSLSQ